VISKGIELAEEAKVEAFGTLKIFQGEGRSTCSGGSTTVVRSARETRSGPSSFTSIQQEERAQGREIDMGHPI
jgi:hypothetical protein